MNVLIIDPVSVSVILGLFVGFVLAITGAGGAILSIAATSVFLASENG